METEVEQERHDVVGRGESTQAGAARSPFLGSTGCSNPGRVLELRGDKLLSHHRYLLKSGE